jgi:trimeric autotransporter adhesin
MPPQNCTRANTRGRANRARRFIPVALASIFTASLGAGAPANAGTLPNTPELAYVTDGTVNAVVRSADTIYIGGQFSRVGPRTGPAVEVALTGVQNPGLPQVSGSGPNFSGGAVTGLRAVIDDGAGGWYIGGIFSHVGGIARTNVAHILADHSVDPSFNPVLDGSVTALALSGSTLYMAGMFTLIDESPRSNIGAYDIQYDYLNSFNPYADAQVDALALSSDGSTVYAGGSFATIGGQPRTAIAALDSGTGVAEASFNPVLTAGGQPSVSALAISGSVMYVGGGFDTVNTLARRTIVALNLGDGSVVAGFAPTPSYFGCTPCASVVALAASGSTIYAGGSFDTIGGASRSNVAALNTADGSANAFDPSSPANINALAVSGSIVYVGGGFTTLGGQPRNYMAAVNAADGSATSFNPNPNGSVSAVAVSASAVYFGGLFSSLGGVERSSLAAINPGDGTATAWAPEPQGESGDSAAVATLQLSGAILYVGGTFVNLGGQARSNIGAVNIADGSATSWNPAADGEVDSIAVSTSAIYAGGSFLNIGGQARTFLAALDPSSGTATSWNPSPDNSVKAIATSGSVVYVGGFFDTIGGQPRGALAAFDATDGSITSWNPNLSAGAFGIYIYAITPADSTIYIGGGFAGVQGQARHNIAGVNASDGTPTSFDPEAGGVNDDGAVWSIAVDGSTSTIYAGGEFDTIGGQSRNLLAGLNASDGSATPFNPDGNGGNTIYALTFASNTLYVAGSFPTFALASTQSFAEFSNDVIFRNGFENP